MKCVNPGIAEICTSSGGFKTKENIPEAQSLTGICIAKNMSGAIEFRVDCGEPTEELWASLDYYVKSATKGLAYLNFFFYGADGKRIATFGGISTSGSDVLNMLRTALWDSNQKSLYAHAANLYHTGVRKNLELHIRTGEDGVFDVWVDRKLLFSFSTTAFSVHVLGFGVEIGSTYSPDVLFSSIILQDTGRIGLERIQMLSVVPSGEQTMEAGSVTSFALGGLDDIPEDTEITGVGAILQATSRDEAITTGTFSLEGDVLGTVDVTDASGHAYEQAFITAHPATGIPFTKSEIEGKTLTLAVDGDA